MSKDANGLFGVVTTYSFDDTVQLRLFCSEREAKDFLKKDFLEERRIDEEENGWDTFCDCSDDCSFASVTNRFGDRDDVTEWRLVPASAVSANFGFNAATLAALRDMMRTFLNDAPRQCFEGRPDEEEALEALQSAWEESVCLSAYADGNAEPDEDKKSLSFNIDDADRKAVLTVGGFRKALADYPAAVDAVRGYPDGAKLLYGDIMVNTECIAGAMFDRQWLKRTIRDMGYKGTDDEIEVILGSCDFDDIVVGAATDAVWNAVGAICEDALAEDN